MHSKEIGILYLSNMEKILKILLIMLMSGCSSLDLNKVAPGYIGAYEAIKVLVVGHKDDNITQELIKNIPCINDFECRKGTQRANDSRKQDL